jgi:hypothetical protein
MLDTMHYNVLWGKDREAVVNETAKARPPYSPREVVVCAWLIGIDYHAQNIPFCDLILHLK